MNLSLDLGHELVVDNFAGGGGASTGIEQALDRPVDLAINHDSAAIAAHTENHPETRHEVADVWDIDPTEATGGQPVGLAWFSPDCRHHSRAKGGRPVSKKVRGLAWVACRWAAVVKPRVIVLENVEEFQDWGPLVKDTQGRIVPDPARRGQTFRGFVRALQRHGYAVEWKLLKACDFGTPTVRKRLFLIARCDGRQISWPKETHGSPESPAVRRGRRLPWKTAADCIDWSLPCPSIFERKKPLAENTMRRIAKGIQRFVLEAADPFIIKANHTASWYTAFRGQSLHTPLQTITTSPGFAVVAPTMVQTGYGERSGQSPRALDIEKPLGTVVAGGSKHALVAAFLAQHNNHRGTEPSSGRAATVPMSTITTKGSQQGLVAASMISLKGTDPGRGGRSITEPLTTVCAGGTHAAAVAAFLVKYYGQGVGQHVDEPLHTIPTRDRFGLVTLMIGGEEYVVTDIGMRMLQPHELAMAQGFPQDYRVDTAAGRPVPKSTQVRLIGNSVCPPLAKAIVEANFTHEAAFKNAGKADREAA